MVTRFQKELSYRSMLSVFWWVRQIFLILAGCFFLLFGIHLLIAAYKLEDPYSFIMTFFASNLIILISAVLLFGFIYRMMNSYRKSKNTNPDEPGKLKVN